MPHTLASPVLTAPLRLRQSVWQALLYALGCFAFCFAGFWAMQPGDIVMRVGLGFFGVGGVFFLVSALPGANFLELRSDGFVLCALFRPTFTNWNDVHDFYPGELVYSAGKLGARSTKMVRIRYAAHINSAFQTNALARALAVTEGVIPGRYGMTHDALAARLNEWLQAYRATQPRADPSAHATS